MARSEPKPSLHLYFQPPAVPDLRDAEPPFRIPLAVTVIGVFFAVGLVPLSYGLWLGHDLDFVEGALKPWQYDLLRQGLRDHWLASVVPLLLTNGVWIAAAVWHRYRHRPAVTPAVPEPAALERFHARAA